MSEINRETMFMPLFNRMMRVFLTLIIASSMFLGGCSYIPWVGNDDDDLAFEEDFPFEDNEQALGGGEDDFFEDDGENVDDDFVVTVQNKDNANGYVFQDTEDWSGKHGMKIQKTIGLPYTPIEDFGEGSFDKGMFFRIPFDGLFGRNTRGSYATRIRPIQRDGGARLEDFSGNIWWDIRNARYDSFYNDSARNLP